MIRIVRPADHAVISAVTDAAFGGPAESLILKRLREDGDMLFELVELEDDEITGHIAFSRLWADSVQLFAALGPLAVRPDRQNRGGGGRLTRAGLDLAKEFGAHAVMGLGHPTYYPRFGFSREAAAQVASPYSASPAFMALALEPGALDQPLTVAYPDAFKD